MVSRTQYTWYMLGVTTFVIPIGIQTVLFPWLVVSALQESAVWLGIAQMSVQLPGLFLILLGGLLADSIDPRRILIVIHLLACLPAFVLAGMLFNGHLSYGVLIVYALAMGTVTAFVQPARDGMLNRIANGQLQKAVTIAMGLTFGAQIIGFFAAGFAETTGPEFLLICQGSILLFGAYAATKLHPVAPSRRKSRNPLSEIGNGLRIVFKSERMRSVVILLTFMSMFFGGAFMVLNPIIVRDIYQGGAVEISLSFAVFMGGTIATTVTLLAIGGLQNQGRGLLVAIALGGVALGISALHLPFKGYLMSLFFWGICGGVAMNMGRTIMQESAPEEYRSRVMSVFSLANMGGMPIGAILMGYCAVWSGPLNSLLIAVAGVWLATIYVALSSNLASNESLVLSKS